MIKVPGTTLLINPNYVTSIVAIVMQDIYEVHIYKTDKACHVIELSLKDYISLTKILTNI